MLAMTFLAGIAGAAGQTALPGETAVERPYLLFPVENANTPATEKCCVDICATNGDVLHSIVLPIAADGKGAWTGTVDMRAFLGSNIVLKLVKGPEGRLKFLRPCRVPERRCIGRFVTIAWTCASFWIGRGLSVFRSRVSTAGRFAGRSRWLVI